MFHGHICGGSLFGARMGHAAKEALRAAGGEGKLHATVFDLSCQVDGVQVSAATTCGNKALIVRDRDERRLVLEAEGNNQRVKATLTPKAKKLALRSKELARKTRKLSETSPERPALELEIQKIFAWLRTAPTVEVVKITPDAGQ
ncbi:MAG: formylmethanofuran dehydrogenase [Deltaproteobacteria bacterium]|nr:MAG: formylmethanofuran dehydrogenase [Deltaproteobacteria bacterium]